MGPIGLSLDSLPLFCARVAELRAVLVSTSKWDTGQGRSVWWLLPPDCFSLRLALSSCPLQESVLTQRETVSVDGSVLDKGQ